jgi:F-type H+-transporting ATPase subunit c
MSKTMKLLGLTLFLAVLAGMPLLAQEGGVSESKFKTYQISIIVGAGIIVLAVAAGALCQAKAISSACEGISRNPASAPTIRFILLLGLILIETLVIYALLVTFIILMVKWGQYT